MIYWSMLLDRQLTGLSSDERGINVWSQGRSDSCTSFNPISQVRAFCNSITRQPIELESCSNPKSSASLLVYFEKNFFRFGFGVRYGWRHNGGTSSWFYGWSYLDLDANQTDHFFGSRFFLVSRLSSEPLEPPLWRHPQISPNPKRKTFFSVWYRRLAEYVKGLNISLAQSAGELRRCKLGKTPSRCGTERVKVIKVCWAISVGFGSWSGAHKGTTKLRKCTRTKYRVKQCRNQQAHVADHQRTNARKNVCWKPPGRRRTRSVASFYGLGEQNIR